ncbi:MAG: DUF2723 domain-containing protein [bacterium]
MPKSSSPLLNRNTLFLLGLLSVVLVFYLYSLCPDVYLIDSGELATVSYALGIAHPTGYPLYTLISYFFAHLPGEPIRNLNLLSALFSVAAAAVLYITARRVTNNPSLSAAVTALFAFSPTIWRTSITNEVYPLTGLFAVLVIYLLYQDNSERILYLIMYSIGLALTNHIIFFSLALPVLIYIAIVYRPRLKQVLAGLLFLMLGLTLYLYIITRTIGGADIAWGNPYNLQRLFWHVTGKQYQVWMFSLSPAEVWQNLINGMHILSRDLLYLLILPSLAGFVVLFRKDRKRFWLLLTILILNLLYTINYSIPDIEPYYIPSLVVLVVTFAYGLTMLRRFLRPAIVLPLACIFPIINYSACTLRNNTFGIDYGRAHAAQLPDSSLLITTHWDVYSPLMYLRRVKGWRKDLVIIDKPLLRRTWYIDYIKQEYPQFYRQVQPSINSYLVELYKFEYDRPYVPSVIQMRFLKMLQSFVDTRMNKGVFLSTPWPDQDLDNIHPEYRRLPYGLTFMATSDTSLLPYDFTQLNLTRPAIMYDSRIEFNLASIRSMLRQNISYLMAMGRSEEAEEARRILNSF